MSSVGQNPPNTVWGSAISPRASDQTRLLSLSSGHKGHTQRHSWGGVGYQSHNRERKTQYETEMERVILRQRNEHRD